MPNQIRYLLLCAVQIFSGVLVLNPSFVLAAYPEKPIRIVVAFGAGSEADRYARLMIESIKPYFPEANLVVENRPGESGTTGAMHVKGVASDGYTLMAGRVGSQVIAPAIKPSVPYRWTDFSFLGVLETEPLICAVRGDAPYKDARALLAAVRKAPGTLRFSHVGSGTVHNLGASYLLKLGGLKPGSAIGVAYPTSPEAATALIEGKVDFACNNIGVMLAPIRAGKLLPLFTTAAGRNIDLPEMKTAREAGFPDMSTILGWTVLVGPAGLPAPVLARWQRALNDLAKDKGWNAALQANGAIATLGTSRDNEHFIKEQFALYDRLALSLGLRE